MDLKTIARFRDVPAAQLAQSRLEADGIQVSLLGVHHVGVNWLISQAIGGIRARSEIPSGSPSSSKTLEMPFSPHEYPTRAFPFPLVASERLDSCMNSLSEPEAKERQGRGFREDWPQERV